MKASANGDYVNSELEIKFGECTEKERKGTAEGAGGQKSKSSKENQERTEHRSRDLLELVVMTGAVGEGKLCASSKKVCKSGAKEKLEYTALVKD